MKYQTKKNSATSEVSAINQGVADIECAVLNPKPYETPVLTSYGDVRDITLGGTFGFGESGAGAGIFEPD